MIAMDLYNMNMEAYNRLVEIFGFRFYRQLKDTGIIIRELLRANNLVTGDSFYILVCFDQEQTFHIRFVEIKTLVSELQKIAKNRLQKIRFKEHELIGIQDVESYGVTDYFNDTEEVAINIAALKKLLAHFEMQLNK